MESFKYLLIDHFLDRCTSFIKSLDFDNSISGVFTLDDLIKMGILCINNSTIYLNPKCKHEYCISVSHGHIMNTQYINNKYCLDIDSFLLKGSILCDESVSIYDCKFVVYNNFNDAIMGTVLGSIGSLGSYAYFETVEIPIINKISIIKK